MKTEINKLWVSPVNGETIEAAGKHPHGYACEDHCLFIGPERPTGALEVREGLIGYLTRRDWAWIYAESDKIRREQEEQYHNEIMRAQEEFFARFEANLQFAAAEGENGGPEKGNYETGAGSAEN